MNATGQADRRRRATRRLALPLVVLLALLLWATPAWADGGVIEGRLRNGTAGAALPAGLDVTLQALKGDGTAGPGQQAKVDAQGAFRFAGLDATAGYTYTISAKHLDVTYGSAPLTFTAGETTKTVELAVYETTQSDAAVSVDLAHSILEPDSENQGLWAIEVLVFNNSGDRTYVGDPQRVVDGKRTSLLFSLPQGAEHLELLRGLDPNGIVAIVNGFAATAPLLPDKREVSYSYMLPLQGKDATYSRAVDYPTKRFAALAADTGGRIEAVQLAQGEPADLGGRRYQTFSGQDLPAGGAVMLRLSGIAANPSASTDLPLVVAAITALAALVGLALYLRRRRPVPRAIPVRADGHSREALLTALAELDDSFEAGEIEEGAYRAARAAQKRRLAKLWQARAGG